MRSVKLTRFEDNIYGTFGGLVFSPDLILATLERNWEDNKRETSCIPPGKYVCMRITSPKFGNTFEVTNVPNRTEILLHKGNYLHDSHGCILLGTGFAPLNKQLAITGSGDAFNQFLEHLKGENEFELEIKGVA